MASDNFLDLDSLFDEAMEDMAPIKKEKEGTPTISDNEYYSEEDLDDDVMSVLAQIESGWEQRGWNDGDLKVDKKIDKKTKEAEPAKKAGGGSTALKAAAARRKAQSKPEEAEDSQVNLAMLGAVEDVDDCEEKEGDRLKRLNRELHTKQKELVSAGGLKRSHLMAEVARLDSEIAAVYAKNVGIKKARQELHALLGEHEKKLPKKLIEQLLDWKTSAMILPSYAEPV